jgi:hypothetical protein
VTSRGDKAAKPYPFNVARAGSIIERFSYLIASRPAEAEVLRLSESCT